MVRQKSRCQPIIFRCPLADNWMLLSLIDFFSQILPKRKASTILFGSMLPPQFTGKPQSCRIPEVSMPTVTNSGVCLSKLDRKRGLYQRWCVSQFDKLQGIGVNLRKRVNLAHQSKSDGAKLSTKLRIKSIYHSLVGRNERS